MKLSVGGGDPMKEKRYLMLAMVVIMTMSLGFFMGRGSETKVLAENGSYEDLKVFTEVLSVVQKNYVEEIKTKDLIYGAIKGMLNTLDAHSAFMPPDVYKEIQVDTKGEFGGLGIQIGVKDSRLAVIAPIEDTPAARAGIKAGDFIVKVDNESTKDMSLMDAVQKMRGAKGTKVVLTIQRDGVADPLVYTLTREIIKIASVRSKLLENNIGYIKITQFQEQTVNDLTKDLKKLREQKAQSLILDLRNNPGGLLTSAVEVSEKFIEPGKLIVYIKGRDGKKDEYVSNSKDPWIVEPMFILVNEGSASASEIVSGALQDWGRAVILGTTTFGKGSVQTILPLSDGSGLRLTTAKYYTPKGKSIQNTGIIPDIVVKPILTNEAKGSAPDSPPLREKDLERHLKNEGKDQVPSTNGRTPPGAPAAPSPSISGDEGKGEEDVQLQKAIELLKTWRIFKELKPANQASGTASNF
jgi:carboxyl-terminal processing protease